MKRAERGGERWRERGGGEGGREREREGGSEREKEGGRERGEGRERLWNSVGLNTIRTSISYGKKF